jgi:hypothetical protein
MEDGWTAKWAKPLIEESSEPQPWESRLTLRERLELAQRKYAEKAARYRAKSTWCWVGAWIAFGLSFVVGTIADYALCILIFLALLFWTESSVAKRMMTYVPPDDNE